MANFQTEIKILVTTLSESKNENFQSTEKISKIGFLFCAGLLSVLDT